eukprot:360667-Chlamydomonas_euryale.AAC.7
MTQAAATFLRLQGPQSPGIARPPRTALVLPAFELPATGSGSDNGSSTGGGGSSGGGGASTEAARKPPRTKRALATLWRNGGVRAFHCGAWPPAAPSVDLGAWMTAADSDGGAGTAALLEAPFYEYWYVLDRAGRGGACTFRCCRCCRHYWYPSQWLSVLLTTVDAAAVAAATITVAGSRSWWRHEALAFRATTLALKAMG